MKATETSVLSAWLIKRSSHQCRLIRIGPVGELPFMSGLWYMKRPIYHCVSLLVTCRLSESCAGKHLPRQHCLIVFWAVSPFFFYFDAERDQREISHSCAALAMLSNQFLWKLRRCFMSTSQASVPKRLVSLCDLFPRQSICSGWVGLSCVAGVRAVEFKSQPQPLLACIYSW